MEFLTVTHHVLLDWRWDLHFTRYSWLGGSRTRRCSRRAGNTNTVGVTSPYTIAVFSNGWIPLEKVIEVQGALERDFS